MKISVLPLLGYVPFGMNSAVELLPFFAFSPFPSGNLGPENNSFHFGRDRFQSRGRGR